VSLFILSQFVASAVEWLQLRYPFHLHFAPGRSVSVQRHIAITIHPKIMLASTG